MNYHTIMPASPADPKATRDQLMARDVATRIDAAISIHGITPVLRELARFATEYSNHLYNRDDRALTKEWAHLGAKLGDLRVYAQEHLTD